MKCEQYPHVHTYTSHTSHALIHINPSTQSFSANLYKHNNTFTYEYFYTIFYIKHSHCKIFILLIGTFTLCNPLHTVTYISNIYINIINIIYKL